MKASIGVAAKQLGVSKDTLRRWEKAGKISSERTACGHRRYDLAQLINVKRTPILNSAKKTVAYARVSSHDQKEDLIRQSQVLESSCSVNGWTYDIIRDVGSGLNFQKRGLRQLLREIFSGQIDRLLRFGSELVFALCEHFRIEVVVMNQSTDTSFQDELVQDVLEIITVFSARLYRAKSRKNQKLLNTLKVAANNV
jgi:excisionase family DNA binding protein